jgi:hypothetical protein
MRRKYSEMPNTPRMAAMIMPGKRRRRMVMAASYWGTTNEARAVKETMTMTGAEIRLA